MKKLKNQIKSMKIIEVSLFEIEDKPFEKKILELLDGLVKINYHKSPMFLTSRDEFKNYLSNVKKPFLASFYKNQRIKYKILIDKTNKPIGGKWSFDEENRKKITQRYKSSKKYVFKTSHHTENLKSLVDSKFNDHPGNIDLFLDWNN